MNKDIWYDFWKTWNNLWIDMPMIIKETMAKNEMAFHWVNRVQTIGDILKEKAGAYDLIHPMTVKEYYQVFRDAKKSGDIKTYCEGIIKNAYEDWGGDSAKRVAEEVLKILEVEG